MKVTIYIDTYRCKECEACVEEYPEVFFIDENTEKAATKKYEMELTEALEKAVSICPTKCIEIE